MMLSVQASLFDVIKWMGIYLYFTNSIKDKKHHKSRPGDTYAIFLNHITACVTNKLKYWGALLKQLELTAVFSCNVGMASVFSGLCGMAGVYDMHCDNRDQLAKKSYKQQSSRSFMSMLFLGLEELNILIL